MQTSAKKACFQFVECSNSSAKIRLFLVTSKVFEENVGMVIKKKNRRLSDWESRLLNIVVSMMRRRIIYSLISQWPPNVEEPTRSILFWAFSFSMCFCIALALIPILSTSSCLVIYGLSFISSKTFSIVFGDPVWPPVWLPVWPLVWPPVSLGIGNRSSTSCNSYLSINSGLPQTDTLKLLPLQDDRFVSIKNQGAALG